jgi:hypothetical protein
MKTTSIFLFMLAAAACYTGAASADTIFSDNFESGNLNNWSITVDTPTTITNVNVGGTHGRVMSFDKGDSSNPDGTATATTSIPNTSGFNNLQVSLDWLAQNQNETSDTLSIQWAVAGSGTWNTIMTFASTGSSFANSGPLNIGAPAGTDIDLRFVFNVDATNEGFQVDNVVLSGTSVPVPGPLAGAGLPGLIAACGGLVVLARRRRQLVG